MFLLIPITYEYPATWTLLATSGTFGRRAFATSVIDSNTGFIYVIGGFDGVATLNDVMRLNTLTSELVKKLINIALFIILNVKVHVCVYVKLVLNVFFEVIYIYKCTIL